MTERLVWRDGKWRDKKTGKPTKVKDENAICRPYIQPDLPAYMSVVSNKMIDGRTARREDLKRSGCREVDPSEGLPGCRTEKWAKRLKMDVVDMSEKRLSHVVDY
jgi:hypothetical protein